VGRRSLTLVGAAVVFALVLVATVAVWVTAHPRQVFTQNSSVTLASNSALKPGDVFALGIMIGNDSDKDIVLAPMTTAKGQPPGLRLGDQAVLDPAEQAGHGGFLLGVGWPPSRPDWTYAIHPVSGYRLPPHHQAEVVVSFTAVGPGAYIVGPFSAHARVSGMLPAGLLPASVAYTYSQYGEMCVQVSTAVCEAAKAKVPGLSSH
jgi:hypothetical protein